MRRIEVSFIYTFAIWLITLSSCAQMQNPRDIPFEWKTNLSKADIDLSELIVVLPRNSFPTINYPKFISKEEGLLKFFNHEPVISIAIEGEAKAYPLNMLTMHEMSNDSLGGLPILPTYCPLCNSSLVYDRRLTFKNKEYLLNFEVSGMLRNSDMIMADKETESWWQQLMGVCVVGELAGAELTIIPSLVISVEEFFNRYPEGQILSPNTGTSSEQSYGLNPYKDYDNVGNNPYERFFNPDELDNRLPHMERVIDIKGKDNYKIYPFSVVAKKGAVNDEFDGQDIVIFHKKGTVSVLDETEIANSKDIGSATLFSAVIEGKKFTFRKENEDFLDNESNSVWTITGLCIEGEMKDKQLTPLPHSNHFAFAFLKFYPDSEIYVE